MIKNGDLSMDLEFKSVKNGSACAKKWIANNIKEHEFHFQSEMNANWYIFFPLDSKV